MGMDVEKGFRHDPVPVEPMDSFRSAISITVPNGVRSTFYPYATEYATEYTCTESGLGNIQIVLVGRGRRAYSYHNCVTAVSHLLRATEYTDLLLSF
jgi:hypothetical protein